MSIQFVLLGICVVVGVIAGFLHSRSIEYSILEKRLGRDRAERFTKNVSALAVDLEMLFLLAIWFLPQPRFYLPVLVSYTLQVPVVHYSISLFHALLSFPFIVVGLWLILSALKTMGNEISVEHKRPDRVIRTGVFSRLRHPQNAGGAVLHIGMSILMSGLFALAVIPIFVTFDIYIAKKEEKELIRSFGREYEDYQKAVAMFFPRIKANPQRGSS